MKIKIFEEKELPLEKEVKNEKKAEKARIKEVEKEIVEVQIAESEEIEIVEEDSNGGLELIGEIEQFVDGVQGDFSAEALILSSGVEENVWQPKNLEEFLKDVPGKIGGEETARGGDFYNAASAGDLYNSGSGSGGDLYKIGGADLYNAAGEGERILYSPFAKVDEDEERELGKRNSHMEIEGINRRFGVNHRSERDKKYNV